MFLGLPVSFPSYASQVYKAFEPAKAAFQKDVFLMFCHILAISTKPQLVYKICCWYLSSRFFFREKFLTLGAAAPYTPHV
ncbi:MAG TPA: hypothetical protein PKI40_04955 [Methanomassiliicoccaceae archaeon]|jgi:hypothetical protein|nr:hypothetical protein [Methanomassiliicoccaceae archaeon]